MLHENFSKTSVDECCSDRCGRFLHDRIDEKCRLLANYRHRAICRVFLLFHGTLAIFLISAMACDACCSFVKVREIFKLIAQIVDVVIITLCATM